MKNIFRKPTIFLIIGTALIGIGLPFGFYGLTLSGGASLGGALVLIALFIVFGFVVLDRLLARIIDLKKLNIYEIIFIIIASSIYFYKNRTLEIEQLNQNSEFMIVIKNNGTLKNTDYSYRFPFNRKIKTNENFVIANNLPQNIDVEAPNNWKNSYYYNIYYYPEFEKVVLFAKTESKMDSLKVLNFIYNNCVVTSKVN